MDIQLYEEKKFLEVVQQSQLKQGAMLAQLLFPDGEELEELMDDYGYEEILEHEHDEELEDLLGEELFELLENKVFMAEEPREQLIAFVNGLDFHLLDWIVLLETEFSVDGKLFTNEVVKKMEKRLPRFPYITEDTTIFDVTLRETLQLLEKITDGAVVIK